jgi:phage terminase Nu1 subunit (DNA packaging protein)
VLITFAELAALKGCSKAAVTYAAKSRIAAAVVERDGRRWVDRDHALELWDKNTKDVPHAKVRRPDPMYSPPADAAEIRHRVESLPAEAIPDLNESRARHEHFKAELAALQVATQRGELVSATEVKAAAFNEARRARDRLMAVPSRVASQLASCSDPRQCHLLLAEEIRVCLRGLSDVSDQREDEATAAI